jgi:hypothetical protein
MTHLWEQFGDEPDEDENGSKNTEEDSAEVIKSRVFAKLPREKEEEQPAGEKCKFR